MSNTLNGVEILQSQLKFLTSKAEQIERDIRSMQRANCDDYSIAYTIDNEMYQFSQLYDNVNKAYVELCDSCKYESKNS